MKHTRRFGAKQVITVLFAVSIISICTTGTVWAADLRDGKGPVIKKQPKSVTVNYPEGATFHVEVENPADVKSYRWEYTDGYHVFKLDGTSASTDTLVLPSTTQDDPKGKVTCIITGKNGAETVSKAATIKVANPDEDKTVFYVGEYAVMPGDTFDIAGTQLGSGTVAFDSNGADITLKDVKVETPNAVFDSTLSPSCGMVLSRHNGNANEYRIHLESDCSVTNNYYDELINASGIAFAAYLYSDDEDAKAPLIRFDGAGKLMLNGGTNVLYTEADVKFDTDAIIAPTSDHFCDGIVCHDLYVEKNRHLNLKVNGTGIESRGQIFAKKGSVIDIETEAPHVMNGDTNKGAMFLYGRLNMTGAALNIHCNASPEQFIPYNANLQAFGGIIFTESGSIKAKDSSIKIDLEATPGQNDYAQNYFGIVDMGDKGSVTLNKSEIGIRLDSQDVTDSNGVYLLGDMIIQNGSRITCDIHNKGIVRGLAVEEGITVKNSDVDVSVSSYSNDEAYGILCNSAELNLGNEKYSIVSKAPGGMAFAANTGRQDEETKGYDPSYKMTRFRFKGNTMCRIPKKSAISLASIPGSEKFITVETFYNKEDTSKPAQEVRIVKGKKPSNTIKVNGKTVKVNYDKLNEKSQTIARKDALSVSGVRGVVTYSKIGVNNNKYEKKFTVNSKTGKITVKKGVKKGTYKLKVKVSAAGNEKYKAGSKNATVTIKVR